MKDITVEQSKLSKAFVGNETNKKLVPTKSVTTKFIYRLFK